MHSSTLSSQQLRLKVRHALLRSLHHTLFYRRLIVANKIKGASLQIVGQAIKKVNSNTKEGAILQNSFTANSTTAKLPRDMNTPLRTNAHSGIGPTSAHTSLENVRTMRPYALDDTMRRANWSTPLSAQPQKREEPFTRRPK